MCLKSFDSFPTTASEQSSVGKRIEERDGENAGKCESKKRKSLKRNPWKNYGK